MIEKEWYADLDKEGKIIAEMLAGDVAQIVSSFKLLKNKFSKSIYFEVAKEQYIQMIKEVLEEEV